MEYPRETMRLKAYLQIALIHAFNKPISVGEHGSEVPGPWITEKYSENLRNLFERSASFREKAAIWHKNKTPENLATLIADFLKALEALK